MVSEARDRHLAGRKARLKPGPLAADFGLPDGLRIVDSLDGLRFVGAATSVAALRVEFQKLERSPSGSTAHVADWTFRVEDEFLFPEREREIILPWHAWGMVGYLLSDVAYGYEPNPLDFSQTGYITAVDEADEHLPWPRPDIGVAIEGELLDT